MATTSETENIDFVMLYITTATLSEARSLAQIALEMKEAACANILPQMESLYHWEGKLERNSECVLILKTLATKQQSLMNLIAEKHSYSCPCIIALPILTGKPEYLQWLKGEVSTATQS